MREPAASPDHPDHGVAARSGSRSGWRSHVPPRWWWLVAFSMLYVVPYYPAIHSANELPRAYLVKAMVDHHRLSIDEGIARWGSTADVSPWQGHWYSNKAPGTSLLTVPAYAASKLLLGREPSLACTVWLGRLVTGILPTLLLLALLNRFLERYGVTPQARQLILVAYGLGSMAMPYSILFISHQPSAVAVALSWMLAQRVADSTGVAAPPHHRGTGEAATRRRGLLAMALAGTAAGWAPLIDYQAAFALLPLSVLMAARLWRHPDRWALYVVTVIAASLPTAALLGYHELAFGSPWRTGYEASVTFASYHQQGFLGMTELRWTAFWRSMIAPDNGLLMFSPWLGLAVPGLALLWRRGERADAALFAAIAILYVLFLSSLTFWRGGWQLGPRYITVMLPFLLAPAMLAIDECNGNPIRRVIAVAACLVGVTVYAGSCAQFPHFPERFSNPIHEVTFRLWADGMAAPNPLAWLGVPAPWSLLPYLLAVVAVVAISARAVVATWRDVILAGLVSLIALASLRWVPDGGVPSESAYQWVRDAMSEAP
jgi:hypothetical protein